MATATERFQNPRPDLGWPDQRAEVSASAEDMPLACRSVSRCTETIVTNRPVMIWIEANSQNMARSRGESTSVASASSLDCLSGRVASGTMARVKGRQTPRRIAA